MGHKNVPREVENNAYADFWGVKEVICASSELGEHIFLRNARDCGQRRKELWLCSNGEIEMRGMILLHPRSEPALFFISLLVSSNYR